MLKPMQIDNFLQDQEFSPKTKEDYGKDLRAFVRFNEDKEPTKETIQAYRRRLEEKGRSSAHISRILYAMKAYCQWQGIDIFARFGDKSRERIRIPPLDFRPPPRVISIIEVEQLLKACQTPLEKALLMFLTTTGVRIGEALGVDITDINWEMREITVVRKGRLKRRQTLLLSEATMEAIREYRDWRGIKKGKLFPYEYQELWEWFLDTANRAGVKFPKGSLFHNLRHFFVLYQKRAGVDLRFISLAAGHTSERTTDRIYGALSPDDIKRQLEPMPWEK